MAVVLLLILVLYMILNMQSINCVDNPCKNCFLRWRFALSLALDPAPINITMLIQELFEARSHPELNPKTPTYELLEPYFSGDYYLHFNNVEKVGVNLQSRNTFGPFGVYAFPADHFQGQESGFDSLVQRGRLKLVHVLAPRPGIRVLDLGRLDSAAMDGFKSAVKSVLPRGLRRDPGIQQQLADTESNLRSQWQQAALVIARISRVRGRPTQAIWNSVFRQQGYDAIKDNTALLNDNPNQTVFLHGRAFDVVKTMPIRLGSVQ